MKDIKDFTLREIEEIQNQAAFDFKLLLRDFFRDHPYINKISMHHKYRSFRTIYNVDTDCDFNTYI